MGLGEPYSSVRIEDVTISGLGRWGEWCEKWLTPQVCKSIRNGCDLVLDYLGWWVGQAIRRQGSSSLPELRLTCWWLTNLSVGWRLMRWPRLALGQARYGREAGTQHKPCLARDGWGASKEKETWKMKCRRAVQEVVPEMMKCGACGL